MEKKLKLKYSAAFRKKDAKHYLAYAILEKRGIPRAYEIAAQIIEQLETLPR